jgi:hypothetical protein
MVVAVIAMWVMQASVDVVTVRYSFVPTVRAVRVRPLGSRSVLCWIRSIDRQDMLVNMIPMHKDLPAATLRSAIAGGYGWDAFFRCKW